MDSTGALGDFLRARRAAVSPADLGLPPGTRRRVPGLRREELAMSAGISSDYYLRLEQGRDRHPSQQVVEALAVALRLDEPAAAHLHSLASPDPRRAAHRRAERVPPGIGLLVDERERIQLVVHLPAPGADSADAMALLGNLVATAGRGDSPAPATTLPRLPGQLPTERR